MGAGAMLRLRRTRSRLRPLALALVLAPAAAAAQTGDATTAGPPDVGFEGQGSDISFAIAGNGWRVGKPDCGDGERPRIFVAPVMASGGGDGEPMAAIQAWANDEGSRWRVRLRVRTKEGWEFPSNPRGRLLVIRTCQ